MFKVVRWQKESKVELVRKAKGKVESGKNVWHRQNGKKAGGNRAGKVELTIVKQ